MVFSSPVFLFIFMTTVYILYRIVPSVKVKNIILLIFSLLFYTYGEPKAIILMLISIVMNYLFGLAMKRSYTEHGTGKKLTAKQSKKNIELQKAEDTRRKICLFFAILLNLVMLCIFKYAGFGAEMLNGIFKLNMPIPNIALPIGISFYTFQAMSYVIDAYKSPDYIQKNIFKLALYITFFPQLVAGPIVKYSDFAHQIDNRIITPQMTAEGIKRFITGLSKKLLIANTMAYAADYVYGLDTSELSIPLAWLGALSYLFQIYFDFSGYSDMAIGLGAMFGFTFKENFNYPYISHSMTDFWRRWHISVSTWFKEYLYIPLGGNRKGKVRTAINKLIVFFCTGLWHGASLNFIVWGLLNGVFLMIESYVKIKPKKWLSPFGHIYTLFVTTLAFVFFRADNLTIACQYIGHMFKPSGGTTQWMMFMEQLTPLFIVTFVLAIVFSMPVMEKIKASAKSEKAAAVYEISVYGLSMVLLGLCILSLSSASYNPFIYFRF